MAFQTEAGGPLPTERIVNEDNIGRALRRLDNGFGLAFVFPSRLETAGIQENTHGGSIVVVAVFKKVVL